MQSNQEQDFGSLLNNFSGSEPQGQTTDSQDLGSLLNAQSTPQQPKARSTGKPSIDAIMAEEGADHLKPVIAALYGQESGSGSTQRTSIDGARGGMQIMPDTFRRYARANERIDDPTDNMRVGVRIIKTLGDKFNNDPSKIATAYFSGDGNVNKGNGNPWKNDYADGNGKRVSGYVSDVVKRIGNGNSQLQLGTTGKQTETDPLDSIPNWKDVEAKPEYQAFTPTEKQQAKEAYFDRFIAPVAGADAGKLREQFLMQKERSTGQAITDTAQNLSAAALKIGPTALKGAADIANMATGDKYDFGVSDTMEKGMQAINQVVGTEQFNRQQAGFEQIMQDDTKGIGDMFTYMIDNPSILVDNAITTIGSMFLPAGAAKGAISASKALGASKQLAKKAAVAASIGTAAVQNAADTFSELKNQPLDQRYQGASVSAAMSILAGIATEGGAEGAIAKKMAGDLKTGKVGLDSVKDFLKAVFKEGAQESGEEVGNVAGEAIGSREMPNLQNAAKRTAFAGTLGGIMGGGTDVLLNTTPDGRLEQNANGQPATPAEPAPVDVHPTQAAADQVVQEAVDQFGVPDHVVASELTPQQTTGKPSPTDDDVANFAESRLNDLLTKRDGTLETVIGENGPEDQEVPGVGLSNTEQAELDALFSAQGNPQALRQLYGFDQSIPSDQSQLNTQGNVPAQELGSTSQPEEGQIVPNATEPALQAAQDEENQRQTQELGTPPSTNTGEPTGGSIGATAQPQPAVNAQAATTNGSDSGRIASEQDGAVQTPSAVTHDPFTFDSYDAAKNYISSQRRNASTKLPESKPFPYGDGSFGVAVKGSPAWDAALKYEQQVGPSGTVKEPVQNIIAQVKAYANGSRGPVFVDSNKGLTESVLRDNGMRVMQSKFGGFYVVKKADAPSIAAIEQNNDKEAARAQILGYVQSKDELDASKTVSVVQATDANGAVVHEQAVNQDRQGEAQANAAPIAQANGGEVNVTTPEKAIEERNQNEQAQKSQATQAQQAQAQEPKAPVTTKLENELRNGEISQMEYGLANGLTEDEVIDRSLFKKLDVPKTAYKNLISDMQSIVENKLTALKRPVSGQASVQKSYEKKKSEFKRTLDLLQRFSNNFEHPFRNDLYDRLPEYLRSRFLDKFDSIATGEKAKEEFYKAKHQIQYNDLIDYVISKQAQTPKEQTPAAPKTEKQARAQKDYSEKWFGTQDKAQAFIDKQGIGASHEVVQDGKRFVIGKRGEEVRRGIVGDKLKSGEIVLTNTGRKTTPFPQIKTENNRQTSNTLKKVDEWLIANALTEAEARGDEFNARQFRHVNLKKTSQADRDNAETYLFDDYIPPVVPSIFKNPEKSVQVETPVAEKPATEKEANLIKAAKELGKLEIVRVGDKPKQQPATEKEAKAQRDEKAKQGNMIAKAGDSFVDEFGGDAWQIENDVDGSSDNDYLMVRTNVNQLNERLKQITVKDLKERIAEDEQFRTAAAQKREQTRLANAKPQAAPTTPIDDAQAKAKADFEDALGDLAQILTKNTRMNIMPEDEQRLLPVLTRVMDAAFRMGYYKFKDNAKFVLDTIRSRMGDDSADQITIDHLQGAYIAMAGKYQEQGASNKREVIDVESIADLGAAEGVAEKPAAKQPATTKKEIDIHTPEGKFEIAQKIADHLLAQNEFKTIVEARKFISGITGVDIKPATETAKQADETIETGVVLAAREIVESGRKQGRSSEEVFDSMVKLLGRQPNLTVRNTTSIRYQAYSTPAPVAYLASELAGVTPDTKLIESTAGNGMLAIGASTKNAVINELNPKRAAMLKAMGFDVTIKNAATETLAPAKSVDAVVINPPFGATKDDNGQTIIYEVKPNYGTREVDHAIVFKTLDTMKDDGKAVLIVGGVNETDEERRREDYRGKSKRTFYYNLYNDYNVTDHFTLDGKLYKKQGASYPVDVIVIDGRGKSARDLPAAHLPQIISSYEELKGKLNGEQSSVGAAVVSTNGVDSGVSESGTDNAPTMGASTSGQGNGTGTSGKQPSASNAASVPVSGDTTNGRTPASGGVSVRGKLESTGVSERSDGKSVSNASNGKRSSTPSDRGNEPGELGGTSTVAGERVESGLNDRRGEEQETETQVAYTPHSGAASVGTLVPKAMRDAIDASLSKIEDQVGSIDQYVADNLGLDTQEVSKYFSAEQVDALALSIRNAEAGRGFIIGDQTGIGKGRVVAAMIKYALVNGKTPIFVTEKPNLYADMIRDLDDIGMTDELALDTAKPRVLITDGNKSIPYTLLRTQNGETVENKLTLRAPKQGAALDKIMQEMRANESLGQYKVIFTTYSQLQTVNGRSTERQNFVKSFGAGNYMIFDESHNAGGGGETQARTKGQRDAQKEGKSLATGRAAFVRELVDAAFGTFFSSATYAKRPDVMDLYSSTNMKLAVPKIADLGEAIRHGGVPMQQAVATMLTTDGQYIRRERTFAGVSYDTVETKVDRTTAENMASSMRSILAFSRGKEAVVKEMQKELDKAGGVVKGMGEKTTVQSANFGSIMHNLIDQMLLSLKAQDSVKHAIERLKAGEKVVMTVSNTMGSFLEDYAKEMGLKSGDPVALSFKDLYMRYLDRQRVVNIKMPNGEVRQHRLTDNELGQRLTEMFAKVRDQIENAGFGSAPISPIDYLHAELQKAGYKTDEITGRSIVVNYGSGTPVLDRRTADIKQRINAIDAFNSGVADVLILNQSGSTGLSLHASSKFKDQRKRHMIIVQAEKNIDTHMQMLGRVHRTGQVIAPAYSQMMADIPAEMRPASVLMKKMASLSANTTASRKSSVTAEGVVDFMNDYGGQVVQEYVRDNPEILDALGGSKVVSLSDDATDGSEEDIRKFTGYIPILPIKQQEEIYSDLIDRYNELIERENALGTNKLEAKAIDLDAKTLSSTQITENKGEQSVFAEPASMEQVDVKRAVRPLSSAEVMKLVDERLDGKQASAVADEMKEDLSNRGKPFARARIQQFTEAGMDEITLGRQRDSLNAIYNNTLNILNNYTIGDKVSISDKEGYRMYGVITDISNRASTSNPAAGSSWKMHIAVANGESKTITLSFSQIGSRYILGHETQVNWYNAETKKFENMPLLNVFDQGATTRREKRYIVTGNILAGFARHPGQIITYTKDDGTTTQGVLMNRQFDFAAVQKNAPVTMRTADDAMRFLDEVGGAEIGTGGEQGISIIKRYGMYQFSAPAARSKGGAIYLDKRLTDLLGSDFYKRGKVMLVGVDADYKDDARAALDYLIKERGEPIIALSMTDKAKEMFGTKTSRGTTATNPHTVKSLTDRLRGVADTNHGKGFFDALVGTGKFKVVSEAEAQGIVNGKSRFSKNDTLITWSKERLDRLMREYAYTTDDSRTKAFAAYISPEKFLSATTTNESANQIDNEATPLDLQQLAGEVQPIMLFGELNGREFRITDHEGRHRMVALRNAGIKSVPVVLSFGQAKTLGDMDSIIVAGQSFEKHSGKSFQVLSATPINWNNADRLRGMFQATTNDIRFSKDATIKAFYNPADDTTYFVADNISKHVTDDNLNGLLLHEVGVHAMTLGKDDAAFAKIKDQFSKMRRVSPAVEAAYARAERAGTPSDEEALGYFVEANPKSSITQRLVAWIKNALRSLGLSNKWTNSLSEADVIAMATSALRRAPSDLMFDAKGRGEVRASKGDLLAPNGKPSNLNAMQYAQVRTLEFKAWFGDWENDPANASKVVDENGEPLVVYHGTGSDFTEFSDDFAGQNFDADDEGFFFTTDTFHELYGNDKTLYNGNYSAGAYAKHAANDNEDNKAANIIPAFINLRNPYTTDNAIYNFALSKDDPFDGEHPQDFLDRDKKYIVEIAKEDGFDSIAMKSNDGVVFVAFKPNQIKSATGNTGAFSSDSNDIRYSNNGDVVAFYNPADDTSYFVSDRISKNVSNDYLHGLLLHEVGVHAVKLGQDDAAFAKIKDQFSKMRRVSPAVEAAYARAERAGTPSDEEALGYFVEANPKSSITQRLVAWIKNALRSLGLSNKWTNSLSEADVIAMATSALRRAPSDLVTREVSADKTNNDIRFSKSDERESVGGITRNVKNNLIQFFGNQHGKSLKTWNLWDKTLATQFHKALKDKHYGKVFNLVNAMQNEVSLTSIRPAELAPGILPRVDDIKTAAKVLIKGKKADSNMDKAANALFAGTLAGVNVMDGRVWTTEELHNKFGLNDTGVALYKQARAAIDASLDEVAAAEGYAMAQGFIPKSLRAQVINNPQVAEGIILEALEKQVKTLDLAMDVAKAAGNEVQVASLGESRKGFIETITKVERIFTTARNLKLAGYAPLMRFGDFAVTVKVVDPVTGRSERDVDGKPVTLFYSQFESEAEAQQALKKMNEIYANRDDVRITAGPKSKNGHEMYAGISPETIALFAEAVGVGKTMETYYRNALTERSALKRRLERKGTAGFSSDMPRVLSNFITSNGRFAAQRYYLRDLNNAIKYIPKEKGDVIDEAIALKKFIVNPNDPAAPVSSALFAWFLGGSVASAVINLSQPIMMTGPYLSQFGMKEATTALAKALPYALGKKQITDNALKEGLKRASQEGIVDAQEIFHLYSVGAQGVASRLAKAESARARVNAFLTLWGSMFATAESFNRKLTFIAAWDVAKATNKKNPYEFAVRAVNETQGIFNKVNRPNLGRGWLGRLVLTFKQYSIMYAELLTRMYKHGGPEGKRAALIMLGVLMLAAGEEGLPFAQDLDDLIDTLGQLIFKSDTNMRRNKRRVAHELLGEHLGDLFLYGISSQLPIDFAGRVGMGNLIPGTSILKPSDEQSRGRQVEEVFGAGAGMIGQIGDAYDAATEGNWGKAGQNLLPTAAKNATAAVQMARKGYATDARGRKVVETNGLDAVGKAIGFNPTKVAEETRRTAPIQQDIALQKKTEASIVDQWARGSADDDQAAIDAAAKRLNDWNESNPKTPISINGEQIRDKARQFVTDKNTRLLKTTPREMRGGVGLDLVK